MELPSSKNKDFCAPEIVDLTPKIEAICKMIDSIQQGRQSGPGVRTALQEVLNDWNGAMSRLGHPFHKHWTHVSDVYRYKLPEIEDSLAQLVAENGLCDAQPDNQNDLYRDPEMRIGDFDGEGEREMARVALAPDPFGK